MLRIPTAGGRKPSVWPAMPTPPDKRSTCWRQTGTPGIPATAKAVRFLLKTQCDDGSWFVETRAKPVQVFFDNGDPHGKSQFISIPATCWAVAGLAAYSDR